MNLNHRVADDKGTLALANVLHQIRYPLNIVIPLLLMGLSIYTVWPYFGNSWQTGSLSLVFLPIVGENLSILLHGHENLILSTIILIGYSLGALSFYLYVFYVTKRHLPAIVTALLTMLPLFPFSGSPAERLSLALQDGDGGHILGLTLIPILAIVYQLYLRTGIKKWLFVSIVLAIFLGLISFFGFLISLVFLFFTSVSESLVSQGRVKLARFAITTILLLSIFVILYNVSLLKMITSEPGQITLSVLFNLLPMTFFLVPILGTFAFLIFDRRPHLQPLFLALGFIVTFGMLHLVRISFVEISLLKQSRYAAEVSFAVAFFLSILVLWFFEILRNGQLLSKFPELYRWRIQLAFFWAIGIIGSLTALILFIPRSL